MIVPDSDDKAAAKLEEVRAEAARSQAARSQAQAAPSVASTEQPPEYSEIEGGEGLLGAGAEAVVLATGSGAGQSSNRQPLPDTKPTNFVALSRTNDAIKGTWVIDPGMVMPPDLLPRLKRGQTEETRPNLSLETLNGSVNVDVYVFNVNGGDYDAQTRTQGMSPRRRVVIYGESRNGAVTSRIREMAPSSRASRRLPLKITQESLNGRITVYLPRAFEGPVRAKTMNGSVKYSPSVTAELTRFSDLSGTQRAFIGRFEPSHWVQEPGASWEGDELDLETRNGSIYVHYLDDLDLPPKPKTGFFSRLFG